MDIKIPGINADSGLELCDGDMGIYLNSLRLYVSNIPASLEKMKNISKEKLHDYTISAHGVKSISEYVGAEEAQKTAKQLEFMAKNGDFDGIMAENDAFIKYTQALVDSIRDWLKKNDVSQPN